MKKYLCYHFFFLMFILSFSNIYGNQSPTAANERIKAFVQVWGLVKYKSSNGAQGKFNADSVFLALVPKVQNADQRQFNELMTRLLKENPGEMGVLENRIAKENLLTKNVDHHWIREKIFAAPVQQQLLALSRTVNRNAEHYYLTKVAYEGNLPHENAYPNYTFNNEAMNLLALAKAWNVIAYLFPYRYVMDQKLELTLTKLIPVFRGVTSRMDYEKGILLLENAIDDSHAAGFLDQLKTKSTIFDLKYYPPFTYKVYQNQLLVTAFLSDSLAHESSLKVGDLIVEINGVKMKEWLKLRSAILPASNQSVKNRLLASADAYAFGTLADKKLNVQVKRATRRLNLNLLLLDRRDQNLGEIVNGYYRKVAAKDGLLKGYEELPNAVALIRAGYFFDKDLPKDKDMSAFSENLNKKKAIIFDMRKYPQSPGLFYYYLPMALGTPAFQFAKYYGANLHDPGTFVDKCDMETFFSKDLKPILPPFTGKIVILTNEYTQSYGEWCTMLLSQLHTNTLIIGSQTAGADGDLKHLNLPGGYDFQFTGNGIFYPNGKQTQRIGIAPDVVYQPSVQEVLSTTDKQLEKALSYVEK